jgi:hypothetical protein
MIEGKSIGLVIFTVLNVLGVGFLLYVLVQFWKEGHRSKGVSRPPGQLSVYGQEQRNYVVNATIAAQQPRVDGRLIRFPVREQRGPLRGDETVKHAVR